MIDSEFNKKWYTQYGWLCPRCGASNAPYVRKCECSGVTYSGMSYGNVTVTFGNDKANDGQQPDNN